MIYLHKFAHTVGLTGAENLTYQLADDITCSPKTNIGRSTQSKHVHAILSAKEPILIIP